MLRIALVGAGRTVTIGHAPALQALSDYYRIVAIADHAPEALDDTGVLLGVSTTHRYTDYHELLAQEEVDVVSITLPHAYHHEVALAALEADAHVITERPLALSVRDGLEILRMAEGRGKQVSVLHYFLYYPPFREAIRLVHEGAIGEPFFVRCEGVTGGYGPGTASYHPEWHSDPEIAGGGVWIDSGYHNIYLCASLMRSPVALISSRIDTFATDLPVDDTAVALLTHENGTVSSVQVAWSVPSGGQRILEVYGTKGTIAIDHEGYALGVYDNATATWRHPPVISGHAQSFIDNYRAIAECLLYGSPPPVTHRDALATLEVVTAGYLANDQRTVEPVTGWERPSEQEQEAA